MSELVQAGTAAYTVGMKLTRTTDGHPYQVLAAKIAAKIRDDDLKPGDPLPTIRTLMETYGTTNATTQRALKQLADDGYINTVPNVGSFVAERPSDEAPTIEAVDQRVRTLEGEVADLREQVRSLVARLSET